MDPLGGAGVHYWEPIAERYGLNLKVVNTCRRSDFPFHDSRLGRKNSYGPFLALCDAFAPGIERPIRYLRSLRYGP